MQPVKITIPGKFWDTFVYKGRLYLFGLDGDIRTLSWDQLISEWKVVQKAKIALVCAFQRSDYLYSAEIRDLIYDDDIRNIMKTKFRILANMNLQIDSATLQKAEVGHQDNPCPFPHADLKIYLDQMYVGAASGLFKGTCNKKTKYPISTKFYKMWDGPVLGLDASYSTIALASGSEGLFEYGLNGSDSLVGFGCEPKHLSSMCCRDCDWAYFSIFASSDNSGFLAEFTKSIQGTYNREAKRRFSRIEDAVELFGSQGYCWGTKDKLCQAIPCGIKVVKYQPWAKDFSDRIQDIGTVTLEPWKGAVVSAGTASFGVVIELENAMVVFPSEGETITIPGEPVNWRIFPRSKHYENQLHILYEDRLDIMSFNHDYLVDQEGKILGTSVFFGEKQSGRPF